MAKQWFTRINEDVSGPFTSKELLQLARDGQLQRHHLVKKGNTENWVPAANVKGLNFPEPIIATVVPTESKQRVSPQKPILERATTKSGKSVALFEDGTWTFISPNAADTKAPVQSPARTETPANLLPANSSYSFRRIRWGCFQQDVRDSEEWELLNHGPDFSCYSGSIGGLECVLWYGFAQEICVSAVYKISDVFSNDNTYLEKYYGLRELLSEKYGPRIGPGKEYCWSNTLYADDANSYGMAVSAGHLSCVSDWETADTDIRLFVTGNNYEITLAVIYDSKQFAHLKEDETKQEHLKDL